MLCGRLLCGLLLEVCAWLGSVLGRPVSNRILALSKWTLCAFVGQGSADTPSLAALHWSALACVGTGDGVQAQMRTRSQTGFLVVPNHHAGLRPEFGQIRRVLSAVSCASGGVLSFERGLLQLLTSLQQHITGITHLLADVAV